MQSWICRSRVSIVIVETCDLWLIFNWFNQNIKYRIWNEELDSEHVSTTSKMEKYYNYCVQLVWFFEKVNLAICPKLSIGVLIKNWITSFSSFFFLNLPYFPLSFSNEWIRGTFMSTTHSFFYAFNLISNTHWEKFSSSIKYSWDVESTNDLIDL